MGLVSGGNKDYLWGMKDIREGCRMTIMVDGFEYFLTKRCHYVIEHTLWSCLQTLGDKEGQ